MRRHESEAWLVVPHGSCCFSVECRGRYVWWISHDDVECAAIEHVVDRDGIIWIVGQNVCAFELDVAGDTDVLAVGAGEC